MEEQKEKLAIVFTKSQCSKYPKAHRTYKDRFGKPLKMSMVMLPSSFYRPGGLDFGTANGYNRNDCIAFINVPWDMIKSDARNENRRYFYLNREEYNIQFMPMGGGYAKIEPFRVTAKELEDIFNWHRRKENKKELQERREKVKEIIDQNDMKVQEKKKEVERMKVKLKEDVVKIYVGSGLLKTEPKILEERLEKRFVYNELDGIVKDMKKIGAKTGVNNDNLIKKLNNYTNSYVEMEELNERFGKKVEAIKPTGIGR